MLISSNDPRGAKAVALATDAGQWLKCRTRDGRKAYGIRSSRDADHVYFVTRTSCPALARSSMAFSAGNVQSAPLAF